MRRAWFVIVVFAAASLDAQPTAACDRGGLLTPAGIGPLRVGMPVDSLATACRVFAREFVPEYQMTRHQVRVGADTVEVWEQGGRVSFIRIDSPAHRTSDSLGVGSAVEQVLHIESITGEHADGGYILYARAGSYCGLTFHLDPRTSEMMNNVKGDQLRMLAMRGAGTVRGIEVRGECKPAKQP